MLEVKTSKLPTLPLKTIWMLSFGYLGVQMAFSLQSSNMGRIFETLGADPTRLGFFFILPPLAGIFVQPIVGKFSDKTWAPRIGGRRLPYLLISSLVAMIVLDFQYLWLFGLGPRLFFSWIYHLILQCNRSK